MEFPKGKKLTSGAHQQSPIGTQQQLGAFFVGGTNTNTQAQAQHESHLHALAQLHRDESKPPTQQDKLNMTDGYAVRLPHIPLRPSEVALLREGGGGGDGSEKQKEAEETTTHRNKISKPAELLHKAGIPLQEARQKPGPDAERIFNYVSGKKNLRTDSAQAELNSIIQKFPTDIEAFLMQAEGEMRIVENRIKKEDGGGGDALLGRRKENVVEDVEQFPATAFRAKSELSRWDPPPGASLRQGHPYYAPSPYGLQHNASMAWENNNTRLGVSPLPSSIASPQAVEASAILQSKPLPRWLNTHKFKLSRTPELLDEPAKLLEYKSTGKVRTVLQQPSSIAGKWVSLSANTSHNAATKPMVAPGLTVQQRRALEKSERVKPKLTPVEMEHHRQEKKMKETMRQLNHYQSMVEFQQKEKEKSSASTGMRRTAATIIEEWKSKAAINPFTDADAARRQREKAIRKLERKEKEEIKKFEIAQAIARGEIVEPKKEEVKEVDKRNRWKVPKNMTAEVYRKPKIFAVPIAILKPETIVVEVEEATVHDVLWIHIENPDGWVATQYVFGNVSKIQLTPESGHATANVREFMLDCLDECVDRLDSALDNCPPEKLKDMDEVREMIGNAQITRQNVRDLPNGHHQFILQTWTAMERSKHQRQLLAQQHLMEKRKHQEEEEASSEESVDGTEESPPRNNAK